MKKAFTILSLISMAFLTKAQLTVSTALEMRNPLIDCYTGDLGGYGPDAKIIADNIISSNPKVSYIEIFAGPFSTSTLQTTDGNTIYAASQVTGFPSGSVNRKIFPNETQAVVSRTKWQNYANSIAADTSPVNINVRGFVDISSGNLIVEVAIYYSQTLSGAHNLNIALTQDSILTSQSGASRYPARVVGNQFMQKNVLRDMITSAWGDASSNTTKGKTFRKTYTYSPGAINGIPFDGPNMNIVAFISKGSTFGEIVTSVTDRGIGTGTITASPSISGVTTMNGNSSLNDLRRVYLIGQDTNYTSPYLIALDSIDTQDTFLFNNVPAGTYYLKAAILPGQSNYASYIPSYYFQDLLWGNADTIDHHFKTSGRVIDLVKGVNPGGPGFIGGLVSKGANFAPGDPMTGVNVILYDSLLTPIGYDVTDQNGRYAFSSLAHGTYLVYVDAINVGPTPLRVVLKPDDEVSNDNDFRLDKTGAVPLAVMEKSQETTLVLYPNPANKTLFIQHNLTSLKEENAVVRNMEGKAMPVNVLTIGKNLLQFDVASLTSGMYYIYLESAGESHTQKFMVD